MNSIDVLLAEAASTDTSPSDVAIAQALGRGSPVERAAAARAIRAAAYQVRCRQHDGDDAACDEVVGDLITTTAEALSSVARGGCRCGGCRCGRSSEVTIGVLNDR